MEPKKYSSYVDIDRDLEILKLEKEIHYQKLLLSVKKTKESFEPQNIINSYLKLHLIVRQLNNLRICLIVQYKNLD